MVPVYVTMSFMSLVMGDKSIYFNSIQEIYEAWVIYNFVNDNTDDLRDMTDGFNTGELVFGCCLECSHFLLP